jgi:hypothetical protein
VILRIVRGRNARQISPSDEGEAMKDVRVRIAAGILVVVVSVLAGARAQAKAAPPVTATRYVCDGRQNLVIERNDATARVRFIDRTYDLKRKPSGIGIKYGSSDAALIIDGASAIFVAPDRLQLGACTEAFPVALRG